MQRDIALALVPLGKPVFAFHLRPTGLRLVGKYASLPALAGGEEAVADSVDSDHSSDTLQSPKIPEIDRHGHAPDLAGAPYVLVSGVGNPARVTATATALLGYAPHQEIRFADHHAYRPADAAKLAALRAGGLEIVCTAKDAVKLAELAAFPLWVLEVEPVVQQSIEGLIWEHWLADIWAGLQERSHAQA